jgi:hypothetical protein
METEIEQLLTKEEISKMFRVSISTLYGCLGWGKFLQSKLVVVYGLLNVTLMLFYRKMQDNG